MSPPNVALTWFFYMHTGYVPPPSTISLPASSLTSVSENHARSRYPSSSKRASCRDAGMVGLGLYIRSNVYIDDSASLFPFACNLVDDSLLSVKSATCTWYFTMPFSKAMTGCTSVKTANAWAERSLNRSAWPLSSLACVAPMNGCRRRLTRGIMQDLGMDTCVCIPGVDAYLTAGHVSCT